MENAIDCDIVWCFWKNARWDKFDRRLPFQEGEKEREEGL